MSPDKVGRYKIKSELGRGGMATVYRAHDPSSNREVAIKLLPPELMHNLITRSRFKRELKLIASLEHPAIVPVYDVGEDEGQPFFVMRYMSGGSLTDVIKKGAFSLQDAALIIERLAAALDHAHARKIIHRDIKPDNVILTSHGPKIMDFGLARLEGATTITQTGIAIGSPHYMSPEQGLGERELDGRCDQYALGVVAFEMLTGEKLFEGDQPVQIVVKQVKEPPRSPSALRPEVPDQLSRIVLRMLSKKREERFASMDQVVEQLKQLKL